jgi:transcription antitermination protein NusB
MSLRHKSREFALQMLFEWDMARQEPRRIEKNFWITARAEDSTREFANELFEGTVNRASETDELVERLAENWRLDRLAAIDRNILRLAIYELQAAKTPPKVVIDEALELAKKFSSEDAPSFLNGILDAAYKQIDPNSRSSSATNSGQAS